MSKKISRAPAARKKTWQIPWVGRLPAPTQFRIVGAMILVAVFGAAASGLAYVGAERSSAAQVRASAQLLTDSQRIAKSAAAAARGESGAFASLEQVSKRFDATMTALRSGGRLGSAELPAAGGQARAAAEAVATLWSQAGGGILRLLGAKAAVEEFSGALGRLRELDSSFEASAKAVSSSVSVLPSASSQQQEIAKELPLLTQKMAKNANALLAGGVEWQVPAAALGKDLASYQALWEALARGSEARGLAPIQDRGAREKLIENKNVFNEYAQQVEIIQRSQGAALGARAAVAGSTGLADSLGGASEALLQAFEEQAAGNKGTLILGLFFFGLFLAGAAGAFKLFSDEGSASERAAEGERQTRAQKQAILTLLDELGELADGNLTTKATASDTFTGAIADAFNVTVDELRRVIKNVIYAANRVGEGANEASKISTMVAASASEQSERLAQTGESMSAMSASMGSIANETAEAANASLESLVASREGLVVVGQAIVKMNAIRDTIQDTSKKIKLVGESSTAIGEVTGLIRDITKQINILALNAAIQAASAGEAGRGFAVVASDVQKLALSSAEAAKRIDDLVLTIQEDAKGAVSAMESSTQEVVHGAELTDQAGDSLKQIEASVSGLAKAIEAVTVKVKQESESGHALSQEMRSLQDDISDTAEQSRHGAEAIAQVRHVAEELRESVGNFTV